MQRKIFYIFALIIFVGVAAKSHDSEISDLSSVKSAIEQIKYANKASNKNLSEGILKVIEKLDSIPYFNEQDATGYGLCSLNNSPSYCSTSGSVGYGICSTANSPSYCSTTGSEGYGMCSVKQSPVYCSN